MKKSTFSKILGVSTVTVFAALVSVSDVLNGCVKEYRENVTTIKMLLKGQQISNHDSRTIFICLSDTIQNFEGLNGLSITPIYENSEEYPIKSFDLKYVIQGSEEFEASHSPFFTLAKINSKEYQYKYKEKSLSQISQTDEPFTLSSLPKKNAHYIINSRATIAGVSDAYEFKVNLWIRIVPKKPGQTRSEWELVCKDVIDNTQPKSQTFDRFYYFDGNLTSHFGMNVGPDYPNTNFADKKSNDNEVNTSSTNVESDNYEINILSYELVNHENKKYLKLETQDNMSFKKVYRIVCYYDQNGNTYEYPYKFVGNGNKSIYLPAYDADEIKKIVFPEINNEIKDDIYLTTDNSGHTIVKSKRYKNTVVECLVGDSDEVIGIANKSRGFIVSKAKSPEDVQILNTYEYKGASRWLSYLADLFFGILAIFLLWSSADLLKSENDTLGKVVCWIQILFALILLCIMIADFFTPVTPYIFPFLKTVF